MTASPHEAECDPIPTRISAPSAAPIPMPAFSPVLRRNEGRELACCSERERGQWYADALS